MCRTLERPRRTLAYRASLFMSHVCLIANSAWSYAWDISCSAKRPIGEPYECRIDQRHLPELLKCIPTVTPNTYDSHLRRSSPEIRAVYFPVLVHDLPVACAQIRSIRAVAFFRHHASTSVRRSATSYESFVYSTTYAARNPGGTNSYAAHFPHHTYLRVWWQVKGLQKMVCYTDCPNISVD